MFCCERGFFFARINTVFFSHISHKTAAAFDEYDEYEYGVFLPLFLS